MKGKKDKHAVTFSALDRLFACPGSASLPKIQSVGGVGARKGSAIHKFLETGEVDPDFEDEISIMDPDEHLGEVREDVYAIDPLNLHAYNYPKIQDRGYEEIPKDYVPGTIDLWYPEGEDKVVVRDYKTGYSKLPPAKEANQLLAAAYCLIQVHGFEEADIAFRVPVQQGREWQDLDTHTVTREDSKQWVCTLSQALQGNPGDVDSALVWGPQCKYCPSFWHCPVAKAKIQAFDSYEDAKIVKDRAHEIIKAVEEQAREMPVETRNGVLYEKEYGTYLVNEEELDDVILLTGNEYPYRRKNKTNIKKYLKGIYSGPELEYTLKKICPEVKKGKVIYEPNESNEESENE